jgi:hypothetical protein
LINYFFIPNNLIETMYSIINIINRSTLTLYIFLIYHNDLQQIAILEPNKCILKNLPLGYLIQANKESLLNNISFPCENYKTIQVIKSKNSIIFD